MFPDEQRMIMTGLYFIRFSSQNVCFNNVYSEKNTNLNRTLEKTNRNRTVSSEPQVIDISVNHGSPRLWELLVTKFYRKFKQGFARVVAEGAGRLREWSQGTIQLYTYIYILRDTVHQVEHKIRKASYKSLTSNIICYSD